MIGLEYICKLYNKQFKDLAEQLGVSKQVVNGWIKEKYKISKKHLPKLSEMFNIPEEYFQKELTDIDKLIIQKGKLERELKPQIKKYQTRLVLSENSEEADLEDIPIYDQKEMNDIEIEITKVKIVEEIREAMSDLNKDYEIGVIEQIAKLIKHYGKEKVFIDTIDALSHYYNVLPEWVGDPDSDEFVDEFLKLAEKHENREI